MVELNTKLGLWSAQQVRQLRAAVMTMFQMEADTVWLKKMKEATIKFNKVAEKMRKDKSEDQVPVVLGVPAVHAFNSWVTALVQEPSLQEGLDNKMLEVIKAA
eukprot:11775767-Karenia_brevis.AAC.1